jgi:hypothetical protein
MNRLEAGCIDEVYMIARWNGPTNTKAVSALCKKYNVPVHLLDYTQRAWRKGVAAGASLAAASDDESE